MWVFKLSKVSLRERSKTEWESVSEMQRSGQGAHLGLAYEDPLSSSIVAVGDCAKPLLPSRVPDLELDPLGGAARLNDVNGLDREFDSWQEVSCWLVTI